MGDPVRGMAAIQAAMAKAAEEQQRKVVADAAKQQREYMIEVLSVTFDKGMAYTNIIILGGYAGAFAIWSYTHDQLSTKTSIWVATLLGISLVAFIAFEIYKMIDGVYRGLEQRKILVAGHPPLEFMTRVEELKVRLNTKGIKWMMPIWVGQLTISVGAAIGALGLLFYNFFSILLC